MFRYNAKSNTLNGPPKGKILDQQALILNVFHITSHRFLHAISVNTSLAYVGNWKCHKSCLDQQIKENFGQNSPNSSARTKPNRIHVIVNELLRHTLIDGAIDGEGSVSLHVKRRLGHYCFLALLLLIV